MHDNFPSRGLRVGEGRESMEEGGGKNKLTLHVNFMQFVMFYVPRLAASTLMGALLECYAWESQNDRLQFIQFILLSQTFFSLLPFLFLFLSYPLSMCVFLPFY